MQPFPALHIVATPDSQPVCELVTRPATQVPALVDHVDTVMHVQATTMVERQQAKLTQAPCRPGPWA